MSIIFKNVAQTSGIEENGDKGIISVGWLDFNQDGLLDLWAAPHGIRLDESESKPKLYLNQGDGTFSDISDSIFASNFSGDTHGTSWADFDNDGDTDLFIVNGGRGGTGSAPSKFFVNEEGILNERATEFGLGFGLGRVRSTIWFDGNHDGLLDLLQTTEARSDGKAPTTFFQQTADGFIEANADVGFEPTSSAVTAQVADLFGNGTQDLILFSDSSPFKAYETTSSTWNDLSTNFPQVSNVRDAAIADFNGDGVQDIFLTRVNESEGQAVNSNIAVAETVAFGRLITKPEADKPEAGISWKTTGDITFENSTQWNLDDWGKSSIGLSNIFIGSEGINPTTNTFTLSSDDPEVMGIFPRTDNSPSGLYIGYDPVAQIWEAVNFNTKSNTLRRAINLLIDSSAPLIDVKPVGFVQPDIAGLGGLSPVLLVYDPQTNQYIDRTEAAGLSDPTSSRSVVSGDFDNDGDIDLYLAASTAYYSLPSKFYDNQGDGTFVEITNAADAQIEFLAPRYEDFNIGINLATGDYDGDGFLDIFSGSSALLRSDDTYSLGTPSYLFQNQGNDNNWLQIDVEGVQSNRDGIGTKVFATTEGITQLREQSGGMHRIGQNQPWLHFGLGENEQVDLLRVEWISGAIQEFSNVAPNQLLKVVENQGSNGSDLLVGTLENDTLEGLDGDDTLRGEDGNDILYGNLGNDILYGGSGDDILYSSVENNDNDNELPSTDSLVMYLPLDNEIEGITPDTSPFGSNNQGLLEKGATIDTTTGAALFDGVNDYIDVRNSPDLNLTTHAKRTITLRFNADDINVSDRKQILWEEGGASKGLNIYIDRGSLYVGFWSGKDKIYLSTDAIQSNTWNQVTLVLDSEAGKNQLQAGAFKGYLNGVKFGEGDGKQLRSHTFYMGLGGLNGGTRFHDDTTKVGFGDQGFAGSIDDVYGYNRALSSEEIASVAAFNDENSLNEDSEDNLLLTSENSDLMIGGLGADQFWLVQNGELPSATHEIADFDTEDDFIGIDGLDISFQDLAITQVGDNTLISLPNADLTLLTGISANEINSEHFILTKI